MKKFFTSIVDALSHQAVRTKIIYTLGILALYRVLVFIPVPFVDIQKLMEVTFQAGSGLQYFAMLLGGSLDNFSIIAVGLAPYINASIIIQLMTAVVPALEEIQEQGEQGTIKLQQYTRYISVPLAFVQGIGMVYFINFLLGGDVIDVNSWSVILMTAFVLTVGSTLLLWFGETITEKGISNGVSLLIFSSIVSGITGQVYTSVAASPNLFGIILFMLIVVGVLVVLSVFLLKTVKEIPIVYAKQGKIEQTSSLPIPLNPVGMVPIIFAIAFATFPYLVSQFFIKFGTQNEFLNALSKWIEINFNIYSQQPGPLAIIVYFILIVVFTFFYTIIVFNPDKMADTIQKRGGYIPGIRPGRETAEYINDVLMHLSLRGGFGLGILGIYSYVLNYIPFIQQISQQLGSLPVVVTGSGVIIIVGVVQDVINKVKTEMLLHKYDTVE